MTLDWGRRYLMCPPEHYEVAYAINPWMRPDETVDRDLARAQWEELKTTLERAGATVEVMLPAPGLPDLVFTANLGIVSRDAFVLARMRHPERTPESALAAVDRAAAGMRVVELPEGAVQEGTGDALPLGGALVGGVGPRSSPAAYAALAGMLAVPVIPLGLTSDRWYHLDLVLCPLDERRALVHPDAVRPADRPRLMERIPEPLVLDADEAAVFAANSVVVGSTVVMPACPPRVGRVLERWGFDVAVVDVGQFRLAGGAVRCLTLPLDVDLGPVGPTAAFRPEAGALSRPAETSVA